MPSTLDDRNPILLQARDPVLALLLSLFPGGGQIYNGHLGKALLVIITYPMSLPLALYDAYNSAKVHNRVLALAERGSKRFLAESTDSREEESPLLVMENAQLSRGHNSPIRSGLYAIFGFLLTMAGAATGSLMVLLLGAGMVALGAVGSISAKGKKSARRRSHIETGEPPEVGIIKLASHHGGRLTLGRVVQATGMSLGDAEAILESLAMAGQVELSVQEDGGIIYEFADLLRLPATGSARVAVEKSILRHAQVNRGQVTLGRLALDCPHAVSELKAVLTDFCHTGIAKKETSATKTLYWFPEFVESPSPRE